jgi:hypothetical protein
VGVTHDPAECGVESIRDGGNWTGERAIRRRGEYSSGPILGGNGNRRRAWKLNLQQMADQIQIPITVCHYLPGTSKWNQLEHRLFSFISRNWRGKPLNQL